MSEQASNHPELYELMSHLLEAGMSIEQVVQYGYDFAFKMLREGREDWMDMQQFRTATVYEASLMLEAARMVHAIADELHISQEYQRIAIEKSGRTDRERERH